MAAAEISELRNPAGGAELTLTGRWTLQALMSVDKSWRGRLAAYGARSDMAWNCLGIEALDSAGAMQLWRIWGRRLPAGLQLRPEHRHYFDRIAATDREPPVEAPRRARHEWVIDLGMLVLSLLHHVRVFIALFGQLVLDCLHLLRYPADLPRREISANIYKSGLQAMPVTALVGFLIGIVLSYLVARQLGQFGADAYIVNILGLGIIREFGPVLVAVLVAGRSGSAMTAQLGVMRVTEEIDALATMGVPRSLRLVFPKVVALGITVPLLVLWASAIGLVGGITAAQWQLDLGYGIFLETLPRVVPVVNLCIGLSKGVVFGIAIGLVACHFGLRVKPNTESLSENTTASVVTAITLVIVIDAIFAVALHGIGVPRL
jgi:phospholipid/cholesterol/gamma-HCH transport system permease protein